MRAFLERHRLLGVWLAMAAIVLFSFFLSSHNQDADKHALQQQRDEQRAQFYSDFCTGIGNYTNALINQSATSANGPTQSKVNAFQADMDFWFSSFHCDFHFIPAR